MIKHLLRITTFFAGLLVLLLIVGSFLSPGQYQYGELFERENVRSVLAEEEDSIDVLLMGDSIMIRGIAPLDLWSDYGIAAYNCAAHSIQLDRNYVILQRILEKQHPKYVILDAHNLYWPDVLGQTVSTQAKNRIPLFRYHNNWKGDLDLRHQPEDMPVLPSETKGYVYTLEVVPGDPNHAEIPAGGYRVTEPEAINLFWLSRFQSLCQRNGAEFLLIKIPQLIYWNEDRAQAVERWAEKLGISYLDMSKEGLLPMDWSQHTSDYGDHLNYRGAEIVTAYLGEYLYNTGVFSDKRDLPEYAQWNVLAEKYRLQYALE